MDLTPQFDEYRLLDSGGGEKVENFGGWTFLRPEPQALWRRAAPDVEIDFCYEATTSRAGRWLPVSERARRFERDDWETTYRGPGYRLVLRLARTGFKHLGIFPEQAPNWDYIYRHARGRVLNLFAYTGAATLAARAAGVHVTHLDAVKNVVAWAKHNVERNGYSDVRFLTDDALAFLHRENRRGQAYNGLILDPPAFGTGPKGERWVLEDKLYELLLAARDVFRPPGFFVLNCYSLGLSAMVLENVVRDAFAGVVFEAQAGELYLSEESAGRRLPAGVFFRFFTP